jgi:hypothetical protein
MIFFFNLNYISLAYYNVSINYVHCILFYILAKKHYNIDHNLNSLRLHVEHKHETTTLCKNGPIIVFIQTNNKKVLSIVV